jgi:internalin A
LRFRYTYNYLPPGLLPRFIVQAHQNLAPGKFRWRTGVVLVVIDCDILVTADPDQRRVEVAVKGPVARRRAALNVVLNHLETVHALNPEAEPTALVPLPDRPDVHVRYQHLLRLEELEGSDHSFIPDGANAKYRVGDLLNGVRRDASTTRGLREAALARENAIGSNTRGLFVRERKVAAQPDGKMQIGPRKGKEWTPMSAFISYSHRDERLRRELEKHLSGLQRQGIISSWCDRKIGAGAEWQGELDTQLEEARLILLLVSVDFINSNYCYDVEMKRALSRHDEADALVIPIMLRPVSLAGTPLAKLQALPRGLKPVMNWSNRDSAFVDIAEGLRDAIEKFADARPKRV